MVNLRTRLVLLSAIVVSLFVVAVAFSGVENQDNSTADTEEVVNCVTNVPLTLPLPENKFDRMLVNPDVFPPGSPFLTNPNYVEFRTIDLGATFEPGLYRVWTISSDDHNDHIPAGDTVPGYIEEATTPGHPADDQPHEEYYVVLGGIDDASRYRTPDHSVDVPGNYDWVVGTNEFFRDDNDNIFDGHPRITELTENNTGEIGVYLGDVLLEETRSEVTFIHRSYFEPDVVDNIDSVIPHSIFVQCVEPLSSDLAVQKTVDGNNDGTFGEVEEIREGDEFTWRVTVNNNGRGDEVNGGVTDTVPAGMQLVAGSTALVTAPSAGSGLLTEAADQSGFTWEGRINSGDEMVIEFRAVVTDHIQFAACATASGSSDQCQNTAQVGSYDEQNQFTVAAQDDAAVTLAQPLVGITKTVDANGDGTYSEQEQVSPKGGDSVDWLVTISNTGAGIAHDYVMRDELPAGMTVRSADANLGTASFDGNVVTWQGDIASGAQTTVNIVAEFADLDSFLTCDNDTNVSGNTPGDSICVNVASVGESDINNPGVPVNPVSDPSRVFADLASDVSIKKYVDGVDDDATTPTRFSDEDAELIEDGTVFTWRVTAENTGDAPADGYRIVDELAPGVLLDPAGQTIILNGPGQVEIIQENGSTFIAWNGNLAVDEVVDFTFTTVINNQVDFNACDVADGNEDGICADLASIGVGGAGSTDIEQDTQQSDTARVNAVFAPVYEIQKLVNGDNDSQFSDVSEIGELGASYEYRIIGRNAGNGLAENARIVDVLSPGVEAVSTSDQINSTGSLGSPGVVTISADDTGSTYIAWDGALQPGEEIVMDFTAIVTVENDYLNCTGASEGDACRNIAQIGDANSTQAWLVDNEQNDPADIIMNPEGEMVISKFVDSDRNGSWTEQEQIRPDEQFSWRVEVTNQGDGTINDAAMRDVLPEGVVLVGSPRLEPAVDSGSVLVESGTRFAVFWTDPQFRPGESVAIEFDAIVVDQAAFDLCDNDDGDFNRLCRNEAIGGIGVSDDTFRPQAIQDFAQVEIEKYPELTISKTVDASDSGTEFNKLETHSTSAGVNNIIWRTEVQNIGDADAANVNFSDSVDQSMAVISATVDGATSDSIVIDGNDVRWNGALAAGATIVFEIVADMQDDDSFAACDASDGVDDRCNNIATLSYPVVVTQPGGSQVSNPVEVQSSAGITLSPSLPNVSIVKDVDANSDNQFNNIEDYVIGTEIVWRSVISNSGDGPAKEVRFEDQIIQGQRYIEGTASISASDGAVVADPVVADGTVSWNGDIAAGQELTILFSVRVSSLQNFATCNFTDGMPEDERCGNTARVYSSRVDFDIAATSAAAIVTEFPVVLATTGASTTGLSVGVGLTIALVAIVTAVATVFIGRTHNEK